MNFFNLDNALFRTIGRLVDLVWINILTLVFSLPIVTMGASFTAMYSVLMKMAKNEEGSVTKGFFRAFKANFKNATKLWIVALLVVAVYYMNTYLLEVGVMDGYDSLKKMTIILMVIIVLFLAMVCIYAFALMARYGQDTKQAVINGMKLAFAFAPRSLCMVVLLFSPIALMMLSDYFFWLWFIYGFTFPGYLIAMLLVMVFEKTEKKQEKQIEF